MIFLLTPNKYCFDKRKYFPSVLFCRVDEKDINSPLEAAGAVVAENINVSFRAGRGERQTKRTKVSF